MTDICCCSGEDCPFKEKCFRFTAKRSQYQSFFCEAPIEKETNTCKHFYFDAKRYPITNKERTMIKKIWGE